MLFGSIAPAFAAESGNRNPNLSVKVHFSIQDNDDGHSLPDRSNAEKDSLQPGNEQSERKATGTADTTNGSRSSASESSQDRSRGFSRPTGVSPMTKTRAPVPAPTPGGAELEESTALVVAANNQLAFDLYRQMAGPGENVFFSPWSISSALALAYEGARGTTAEEIQSVSHFPSVNSTRAGYASLLYELDDSSSGCTLDTANALWAQKSYPFLPSYTSIAGGSYGAATINLDFANEPEESRLIIDQWIEVNTGNAIEGLLPEGSLDPLTRLVMTTALSLKGRWEHPFPAAGTHQADFHTNNGTTQVSMMSSREVYGYAETDTLQVLRMPYATEGNRHLSMLVLLPRDRDLAALEGSLTPGNIAELNRSLVDQEVRVSFPRFRVETDCTLSDTLAGMGMPSAFSPEAANFSGMDGTTSLSFDEIYHRTFLVANEQGTEAAAASVGSMRQGAIRDSAPVPVFQADHPFMFIIQDDDSGLILFMGRIADATGP